MSSNVERYTQAVATRKVSPSPGKIAVNELMALHACHLPRHQEIIRIFAKVLESIANQDADEENEPLTSDMINAALGVLVKADEICADGLQLMGYEIDTGETDVTRTND